tara:strand:- start:2130 stop:2546 length:417 start_codon:yes stop_codon:yes gene_type:complete
MLLFIVVMDTLSKYIEELTQDVYIDEFNVRDKQMMLPGIKHKWAGRQIRCKLKLRDIIYNRRKIIDKAVRKIIEESPVKLSIPVAENRVKDMDTIKDINNQIGETELLIEFLEKTDKTLNSMTWDIKNICDIMKLELQ